MCGGWQCRVPLAASAGVAHLRPIDLLAHGHTPSSRRGVTTAAGAGGLAVVMHRPGGTNAGDVRLSMLKAGTLHHGMVRLCGTKGGPVT